MDRRGRKSSGKLRGGSSTPEFIAIGTPSPPKGSMPPFSFSPMDDGLHAFAKADGEAGSPRGRSVHVRLLEFMDTRLRHRRRRKPASSMPGFIRRKEKKSQFGDVSEEDVKESTSPWHQESDTEEKVGEFDEEEKSVSSEEVGDTAPVNVVSLERLIVRKVLEQGRVLDEQSRTLCSADDISWNKQEQGDEVLALEAIYDRSFIALNTELPGDHLPCFKVEVPMDAGRAVEVVVKTDTSEEVSNLTLQHFPPVNLALAFPPTYPSHSPPAFVLESSWLAAERLESLCDRLYQLWEEHQGEVVVYSWTEFLRSQAPSLAGETSEKLMLDFSVKQELEYPRVISGPALPASLQTYNDETQREKFLASFHTCNICFSEYSGKEFIRLLCNHAYCRPCMQQYSSIHVKEGTVERLKCPGVKCIQSIPPFVLKELLGEEDFERWDRMLLEKMVDITYCPRVRCGTLCIRDEQFFAQCEKCRFSFCDVCKGVWHGGKCLSPESRLRLFQERVVGSLMTEEQRRKESELVNELKSLELVKRECKRCPTCGMGISKAGGCNKMNCRQCGKYFCFICGRSIENDQHFFRFGSSCNFFSFEELLNIELNERPREEPGMQETQRVMRACPSCGQRNPKVSNNNHIICGSCQNHYCGICNKLVRKSSEHFGPNKCKQHSTE